MGVLKNGTYRITCSRMSDLFVGIDTKQHREERRGHIKEGTPIKVMHEESATMVEVQNIGGDHYHLKFMDNPSLNLGCDVHNLRKNNKVFVTKESVEWTIEKGDQEQCMCVQVRDSGMYWTVPSDAKPKTQITLEKHNDHQGQEWCFEQIMEGN